MQRRGVKSAECTNDTTYGSMLLDSAGVQVKPAPATPLNHARSLYRRNTGMRPVPTGGVDGPAAHGG
eukprot:3073605-Pyramimonas_sp.AAC.1